MASSLAGTGQTFSIALDIRANQAASITSDTTQGSTASGIVAANRAMVMEMDIPEFFQAAMDK